MDEAVTDAAKRARERLEAGESVGEIVRALTSQLGRMHTYQALCAIEPIGLGMARCLVETGSPERSFAHLHLAALKRLVAIGRLRGDSWLQSFLQQAVLHDRPWLFVVAGDEPGAVRFYRAKEPTPDPNETGTSWARDLTLSNLRDRVRAQVMEPEWRDHVEVVRDEADALLIRFTLK